MRKVNLLYVITKLELGGAQKQLLSLISRLDRQRYNPILVTACDGLLIDAAASIDGLSIIRSKFLERPLNPLKDLLALCQIYRIIRKNKIDIVHTHSSKAGIIGRWAARFAKAKIIIHSVHGWSFNDYQNPFWRRVIIWLEKHTARITHKLIVVSRFDLEKAIDCGIGRRGQYALIRYGIDYGEIDLAPYGFREELQATNGELLIGMISCLKPQKSPQDFINLAYLIKKSLPQARFILVGDGALRKKIEGMIYRFGLKQQVVLTGWRRDIPRILSGIDVFVLTSLWEGLPISVLEAMASALPVVATNTGGIAEVLCDGSNGFLIHPGNLEEMAKRLIFLAQNKTIREKIGRSARNSLSADFRFENMAENTQRLYGNLLKG